MTRSRNLRREVSTELVRRGYRRFDRMHILSVYGEWHFWVDTGPLGERADISPFVGIRYDALELLLAELLSLPPDEAVGSIGANIGYIVDGEYRQWAAESTLGEVLTAIEFAFQKLRPLMAPDNLAEGWKMEAAKDPLWQYREIALLVLRNDSEQAKAKLLNAGQDLRRHEDEIASEFRKFEERVLARLK